jgi:hypothetical protein
MEALLPKATSFKQLGRSAVKLDAYQFLKLFVFAHIENGEKPMVVAGGQAENGGFRR